MAGIIIASHTMKPSSPTPLAKSKNHKLSFLDQTIPPIYLPIIFLYKNDQSIGREEISRRLKQSLSEILTVFYPLTGVIKQNSFVDCTGTKGVEMVEALVHGPLSQFTENPKIEELDQLLATDPFSYDENTLLLIKTCFFDCGSFSIGVSLSHRVGDVASFSAFMNAWAATCRGEEASSPSFDMALHFPPRDIPLGDFGSNLPTTREEITTQRLFFDRDRIEKLRDEASSDEVKKPSRVEAVTAFIWRRFIEANKSPTTTTSFAVSHAVNMRQRAVPPISDNTFGNCIGFPTAAISSEEDEGGIRVLVSKLRKAIRGVDDEYIERVVKCEELATNTLSENGSSRERNCFFTSWIRFPLYEVDFGWGKPARVCCGTLSFKNGVVLMSTNPSSDGIEAWVNVRTDQFSEL